MGLRDQLISFACILCARATKLLSLLWAAYKRQLTDIRVKVLDARWIRCDALWTELKNDAETKHEPPKHEPTTMSDLGPETYIGQTLMCFSAYSNFKKIIKMESQPKFLTMFHGLKFFGMAWIVMVHTLFYGGFYVGETTFARSMNRFRLPFYWFCCNG